MGSSSPVLASTSSSSPAASTRHGPARAQAPDRVATNERPAATEGPTDFVKKLARILQEPSFQPVISWTPQGDAFVVKDVTAFSHTVLPRMYKHQNFSSFVRQLNKYDFHKVSVKEGAEESENSSTFRHPDFRSDTLDKLDKIKRKVTVQSRPRTYAAAVLSSSSSPTSSPVDTNNIQSQLQDIVDTQEGMSAHIQTLEEKYHDVLAELVGIQRTMAQQDQLTQTLIQYIL
ncbi:HSF-type DNA-binding-domain-containing protein, partial [Mucidula mucida]